MKITRLILAVILTVFFFSQVTPAFAQGTAFTYQGRLLNGNNPANGYYDLSFSLFGTNSSGSPIAGPITNTGVLVSNGLFTTILDFGSGVFTGSNIWLEIQVQTNLGNGFTTLVPRQPLTPTPYAICAGTVVNGAIGSAQIASGAVGSTQLAIGSVTSDKLAAGVGSQTFYTTGNFTAPTNVTIVFVTLVGGGGGGGAGDQVFGGDNFGGGGGGAGGFVLNYPVPVTPGNSYTVTVGGAGAGAPYGATTKWFGKGGSSGGNTDFGGRIYAYGGSGGNGATGVNEGGGGEGGSGGSTTAFANLGNSGNLGGRNGDNNSYVGGAGASSPFGSGGSAGSGGNGNGGSATGYGAGGGGGPPSNNNNGQGGNGSPGLVIVRY